MNLLNNGKWRIQLSTKCFEEKEEEEEDEHYASYNDDEMVLRVIGSCHWDLRHPFLRP